jgi:hypothetical protein
VVTADGDQSWWGWHDTELGQDCAFAATAAGEWRCLPVTIKTAYTRYLDTDCTEPVTAIAGEQCGPWDRVRVTRHEQCSEYTELREVGAEMPPNGTLYELDPSSGQCTVDAFDGWRLFTVGSLLGLSEFASAEQRLVGRSRLMTEVLVSADGAYSVTDWVDSLGDMPCRFARASDGLLRCLPHSRPASRYFADEQCSEKLFEGESCEGMPAAFSVPVAESCPVQWSAREAVAHEGVSYALQTPSECQSEAALEGPMLYSLGDEIAPAQYVAIELTSDDLGPRRLHARYRTSSDGFCAFLGWWDTDLNEQCSFQRAADGTVRCLPGTGSFLLPHLYTDDQCREPMAVGPAEACDQPSYVMHTSFDHCERTSESYRVRGPFPGSDLPPLWRLLPDGSCVRATIEPGMAYVDYGEPLDPGQFVEGVEVVE